MVNIIDEYESGRISYDEFQLLIWGSGQHLFELVGEYTFYLNAPAGEFYKGDTTKTNYTWCDFL